MLVNGATPRPMNWLDYRLTVRAYRSGETGPPNEGSDDGQQARSDEHGREIAYRARARSG